MFTFHIVVNLSSGHDVMKSDLTPLREDDFSRDFQSPLEIIRTPGLTGFNHKNTDTHEHTGAQVPDVWAPEQSHSTGERVKALWGSCQTCIFGMYWMWGSEIIDWGLAGPKKHEGRGRVKETDIMMVTQAPEPPFWPRWNIHWWIPPTAHFNLVERGLKNLKEGSLNLLNQFRAQMQQFIHLLSCTQSNEKTLPPSCLYS